MTYSRVQQSEGDLDDNPGSTSNASLVRHYERILLHSLCSGKVLSPCALNGRVSRSLFSLRTVLDNARTCMAFQFPLAWRSEIPFKNMFLQDFQEGLPQLFHSDWQ